MTFLYQCTFHGEFESEHRIGEAPNADYCPDCLNQSPRVFTAPLFQEDRIRFWKSPHGGRHSNAFGQDMPDSRQERRRLEKATGIELMTQDEIPAHVQFARDYGAHLKAGKERLPNDLAAAAMSPPPEPKVSILDRLRKEAPRLGEIPSDRYIHGKTLPAFPKDVSLE